MIPITERKKAYICCAFYGADNAINQLKSYCKTAYEMGYIPVNANLFYSQFINLNDSEDLFNKDFAMAASLMEIDKCNELWIIGDIGLFMNSEIAYAKALQKPIRKFEYSIDENLNGKLTAIIDPIGLP